ncbi:MAG: hypothetical protein HYV48_05170 [Candidatus Omnitrophica bacterium]|nr:hypothetical protein [Candidatus Omnitrophota bacterium]
MQKRRKLSRAGFTYAEILMAIIVLAIAIVPLLGQFYIGFQGNKTGRDVTIASNLASGVMDEIRSKAFEDPDANKKFGPETDEDTSNRIEWDDVDDYNGWTETPPRTIEGYPMDGGTYGAPPQPQPDFSIFRYEVVIESVEPDPPASGWKLYQNNQATSLKADYKRIIVTVSKTDNSITPVTLTTIRARY